MIDLAGIQQGIGTVAGIVTVTAQNLGILAQTAENPSDKSGVLGVLSRLGIVPEQPQGFVFHVAGEDRVELNSDITDHFVENNTTLQDQIALKPVMYHTQGFIGELNNVPPPELLGLRTAVDKLSFLAPFTPQLSAGAIRAYNTASQVFANAQLAKRSLLQAASFVGIADQDDELSKQEDAYRKFETWWNARQLFTVQTPWKIYKDMAIQTIRVTQDDSEFVTDFELSFKQVRFAQTLLQQKPGMGRANAGFGEVLNKGVSKPVPSLAVNDTGLLA